MGLTGEVARSTWRRLGSAGEDARATAGLHPSDEDLSPGTPGLETGATVGGCYLAEAAGGFQDHGEDAGFVAGYEEGDVPVDGNLSLEQLLASGVDVGGVSEGEVAT